jgi:hypothetical protein
VPLGTQFRFQRGKPPPRHSPNKSGEDQADTNLVEQTEFKLKRLLPELKLHRFIGLRGLSGSFIAAGLNALTGSFCDMRA